MGRTKKYKLSNVQLNEVSLVGKGDNPEAHILLLKTHPNAILAKGKGYDGEDAVSLLQNWFKEQDRITKEDGEAQLFQEIADDRELRSKIWDMVYMLEESICSIISDDSITDKSSTIQQSVEQFKTAVTNITKGGMEHMAKKTVEELQKELDASIAKVAELEVQISDLTKEKAELTAEVEKGKADDKSAKEEIDKSALPESVQKYMAEQEEINKANAAEITKLKEEGIERECLAKAAMVPAVGAVAEISALLKDIQKVKPELADKVLELFKTADARIKQGGLFKEEGKEDSTSGATALEKLNKMAEDLHKEKPEISIAKCFTMVYDTNEDLRKQYMAENRR